VFVGLSIQHEVLYCCLWPVLAVPHFSTLSHKRKDIFTAIEHKIVVLIFSTTFDRNDIGLRVKCPLFVSDFNETWIFFDRFSKQYSYNKFNENSSSGSQVVPC
jgi:hypothetical protein